MNLRVGGTYHYGIQTLGGTMWGKFTYREIVPQERQGGVTRHPSNTAWPLEIL